MDSIHTQIVDLCKRARIASRSLVSASAEEKNTILKTMAELLGTQKDYIREENKKDISAGKEKGLSSAMLDRLELSDSVINSMISGLHEVVALPEPIGKVSDMVRRPNGLMVGRMSIPLGVIAMIYESRPNVTVDAAALCLKAGNGVILRGGSEAIYSNRVLAEILQKALAQCGFSRDCIQVVSTTERSAVNTLLEQEESVDLIIPRGGEGLIRFVAKNSRIPVLKHYKGVCHIFIDKDADLEKATPIVHNAKVQRPGVCNALEGLLIHEDVAAAFLPEVYETLVNDGVRLLGCPKSVQLVDDIDSAEDNDWGTEFLDLSLCVKVVSGYDEAKAYIEKYGSQHTECIITENYSLAQKFIREIDASAVMVNASTRFNDGGELGLGTEIGISTTKLHAYGPMGLDELTTRKFIVFGEGQVRV